MKSPNWIPSRGLSVLFPARGGSAIGSLGIACLMVLLVFTVARMSNDPAAAVPQWQEILTLLSAAAIFYSIQFNPKGTAKSPMAFVNPFKAR